MMIRVYCVLCVVGFVLPYAALTLWFVDGGSFDQIWTQIVATRLSLMAWLDVVITAVVVVRFIRIDSARLGLCNITAPLVGTCLVGPSFGLPLYLLLREAKKPT